MSKGVICNQESDFQTLCYEKRQSYRGFIDLSVPQNIQIKSKPLQQKYLSPSVDYFKTQISKLTEDSELQEASIATDIGVDKNVKILEANRPSFHMNKSSNTADTADTQLSANQSTSYLDIPLERIENSIFTTYEDSLGHKKLVQNKEEAIINIFSFKKSRSLSAQAKSRAASRYKDCSPESKTKDVNKCNTSRTGYRISKDILINDFREALQPEDVPRRNLITPRLGTICSFVNLGKTRQNSIPSHKIEGTKKKRSVSQLGKSKNPLQTYKKAHFELVQEKENLKIKISQLKKNIKEEELKRTEYLANAQNWTNEVEKINKRSNFEKRGQNNKNQLYALKREVISLLEEIDGHKLKVLKLKDSIEEQKRTIIPLKEQVKELKVIVAFESKEKDSIKFQAEKSKKALAKTYNALVCMENEKNKFKLALEKHVSG